MKVKISINAKSKEKLIKELKDIVIQIQNELKSPICINCTDCKDKRKGCFVGGGSSETGIESEWELNRTFNEHKSICKSKVKR